MQPAAECERRPERGEGPARERSLQLDRAPQSRVGAAERDHVPVALRSHHVAVVVLDDPLEHGAVVAEQIGPPLVPQPLSDRRGILDVGQQQREGSVGRAELPEVGRRRPESRSDDVDGGWLHGGPEGI